MKLRAGMRDTMPKVLDSDTESEIPVSIQSNNNSEPNTDNEEKPETDALPVGRTSLPSAVENGNISDTDSICSNQSNTRTLPNGNSSQTSGPSLPPVRPPSPPSATANGNSSSSCASNNPNNCGYSSSGSTSSITNPNLNRAAAGTPVAGAADRVRKYRHQNFSKNIYIGTKNAEKWDTLRNLLQFKNDVEFVTFLLRLAEVDDRKRKNRIANGLNGDSDSLQDVLPGVLVSSKSDQSNGKPSTKKTKRVQFQESVNIINDNNSSSSMRTSGGGAGIFDFHEDEDDNENGPGVEFRRRRPRSQQPLRSPLPPSEDGHRDEDAAADGGDEDEEQFIVQNIIKKIPGRVGQGGNEVQQDSISSTMGSVSEDSLHTETEVLDYRIAEKIKTEMEEKQKLERKSFGEDIPSTSNFSEHSDRPSDDEAYDSKLDIEKIDIRKVPFDPKLGTSRKMKRETGSVDLRIEYEEQEYRPMTPEDRKPLLPPPKKPRKAPTTKNKACTGCGLKHGTDPCPLNTPLAVINNKIELNEWIEQNEDLIKKHKIVLKPENPEEMDDENEDNYDDDEDDDEGDENEENQFEEKLDIIPSFAETSLPSEFELRLAPLATTISTVTTANSTNTSQQMQIDANESSCSLAASQSGEQQPQQLPPPTATVTNTINHGLSIYTKIFIPKYTQLGPVIGLVAKETEIQDDCNMRYIYEIFDGTKSTYINMENKNQANWLRYLRPARHRDQKNCVLKVRNEQIVFITCMDLEVGSELLYWSEESNSAWGKKKMEKTNCGGCNLKFDHPLYYRTHCSVFHDPAFSLTIRKYHCKVCGIAVLGKENIMKHAEKMHDGKGAYQCQFCSKFFLRLNYLEMHRTYGCNMNPQRARPLCDFCGRKFCQPQKLKVHIKRMHSDMAEVLRDFQCKLCSKLLGSRAALQRHSKEVHSRNSAVVSCPRCQKLFQNRSNLKIHMLTHSGVRPFKCAENECAAAFTTKQCLQFHYKKVHGYTQEQMPKIERSVAYTFDAYSGGMNDGLVDLLTDGLQRRQRRKLEPGEEGSSEKRKRVPKDLPGSILKTKNILESFSEICKNDSNLSLLSTKISSILSGNLKDFGKVPTGLPGMDGDGVRKEELDDDLDSNDCAERDERLEAIQRHLNQPLSDEKHEEFSQLHSRLSNISAQNEQNAMHYKLPSCEDEKPMTDGDGFGDLNSLTSSNQKYKEFMNGGNPGLVISKGSKKWISDNGHMQDDNNSENMLAAAANRDFLTKLIMNGGNVGHNTSHTQVADDDEDDDDNSTILDVVDSNNQNQQNSNVQNQQQSQQQQQQQQQQSQYTSSFAGLNNSLPDLPAFQNHTFPTHFNHQSLLGSFYNNNGGVTGRNAINTIPTSASMLVEAALNSVSNIINEAEMNNSSNENQNLHMDIDGNNTASAENNLQANSFSTEEMNSSVDEMKMMKPHGFPLPMNSMSQFSTQSPDDASIIQERNELEVRPKSRDKLTNYGDGEMLGYDDQPHQQQQSQSALHKHTPSVDSVRSALSPDQNDFNYSNSNGAQRQQQQAQQTATNSPARSVSRQIYGEHDLISPASTPSLPRYDFGADNNSYARRQEKTISSLALENFEANLKNQHHMQHLSSDEDSSIVIAENLSVSASSNEPKLKITNPTSGGDFITPNAGSGSNKYESVRNSLGSDLSTDLRLKYNSEANVDLPDFRASNAMNETSDFQGLDMTSRTGLSSSYSHSNFQVPSSGGNLNFNRYHHHIYDILNEREQHQQQQQQQQQHQQQQQEFQLQQQQQQQQMQHMLQDHIGQDAESEQPASVDLSRTSNYLVPSPPSPAIPYSHPHPDMIRMVSLDLSANSGGNMIVGNTPHHVRHPSFLSSQIQHSNRDSLPDHHRLLASEQLAATNHRLLVDPAAHLIFEQNNRLLAETPGPAPPPPRHVVSPQRGFGAYHHHHHHQVGSSNYHHHSVKQNLTSPPLNQHASAAANYHPFPTYY